MPPEAVDHNAAGRRRLVAIAGHRGDVPTATAHLDDPDPRVRASALRALDRCHGLTVDVLDAALDDHDASVRRTAAELAAHHPGSRLAPLLDDQDATVVEVAAWALGEWGSQAANAVDALTTTASTHDDSLCREAAVAALGAIGDPAGLSTVIAALGDKAAIRRRATVALAAFDGPDVTTALQTCLTDRDWQVRQVAEDLLGRTADG